MEKLSHMIKIMNFVVDECDGETFLHNEANSETRKVHIISDETQQHIITKRNKKKRPQNYMFSVSKIQKHFRKNTSADIQLVHKHSLGSV